jgi:hypothetical protein
MKKIIYVLLAIILATSVIAIDYKNFDFFASDKMTGKNMVVYDFSDDLQLIEDMIANDMVKNNYNELKADVSYGRDNNGEDVYNVNNFKFNGKLIFDDKSNVEYKLTDFKVDFTNVDEWNTQIEGNGILKYKTVIIIEKEIPVHLVADIYNDGDNFRESVDIQSTDDDNDLLITLKDDGIQRFIHQKKCIVGCDYY